MRKTIKAGNKKSEQSEPRTIGIFKKVELALLLVANALLVLAFYRLGGLSAFAGVEESFKSTEPYQQHAQFDKQGRIKLYNTDLHLFNVTYLPDIIDGPGVAEILEKHDVKLDTRLYSLKNEETFIYWRENMRTRPDPLKDRRIYIANAGPGKGHGIFCDSRINAGELIDVYTGEIVFKTKDRDSSYQWSYETRLENPKLRFDTDSRVKGNWMRFVNDDPGTRKRNLKMVRVPYRNRWYVLYVASRDIVPGEELLISYGPNYWKKREFV